LKTNYLNKIVSLTTLPVEKSRDIPSRGKITKHFPLLKTKNKRRALRSGLKEFGWQLYEVIGIIAKKQEEIIML
jgi:hypothetical protein